MGAAQFFIGMLCMFLLVLDCYFINNISTSARRVDLDVSFRFSVRKNRAQCIDGYFTLSVPS